MSEAPAGQSSDPGAVPLGGPAPASATGVVPVEPVDPMEPYRRWAVNLFAVLVVVGVVGMVVVLGAIPGVVVFWVLLASVVLMITILLVVIFALRRRDGWAVHAIAPICYVIIAAAGIRFVVALSQGNFTIPLEGIGALLVLTREHRAQLLPGITEPGRRRVWLVVAGVVMAQLLPVATGAIASGGPLGAQPESLDLQVGIDCTTTGEPGGAIPVRAAWTWRAGEVFPPPTDGLLVQWNITSGDDDAGAGAVVDDLVTMSSPAIWQGSADPAATMIQPLTRAPRRASSGSMSGRLDSSTGASS